MIYALTSKKIQTYPKNMSKNTVLMTLGMRCVIESGQGSCQRLGLGDQCRSQGCRCVGVSGSRLGIGLGYYPAFPNSKASASFKALRSAMTSMRLDTMSICRGVSAPRPLAPGGSLLVAARQIGHQLLQEVDGLAGPC